MKINVKIGDTKHECNTYTFTLLEYPLVLATAKISETEYKLFVIDVEKKEVVTKLYELNYNGLFEMMLQNNMFLENGTIEEITTLVKKMREEIGLSPVIE